MRRALLVVLAAVTAGVLWLLWPTEARRVRARVEAVAHAASVPADESELLRVARIASLARALAPDVLLEEPDGTLSIAGREAVVGLASRLATPSGPTSIELANVDVSIDAAGTGAAVTATVRVRSRGPSDIERADGEMVRIELTKMGNDWLVRRVSPARALTRPPVS